MSFSAKRIKSLYRTLVSGYANSVEVSYTHPLMLEITKAGINKGYALEKISGILKINHRNIATVGDSGNDVSMSKLAGLSFGLKTRSEHLKNVVSHYLDEPKKNGVANIINKYLIQKKIELVITDLDGTLLNDQSKLVDRKTKLCIQKLVDEDKCNFAIASGRGLDDCLLVLKNLQLKNNENLFVIGTNGSFIYDVNKKMYLYKNFMNKDIAKELCKCFFKFQNSKHIGQLGAQIFVEPKLNSKNPHQLYMINRHVVLDSMVKKSPHFIDNN
jgi:hydroxymethylpyrimidine pyrophosphatase-like HAD family hydrolase